MIFITGDQHRDFSSIYKFCKKFKTTKKDIMIILGDSGINYFLNSKDITLKKKLAKYPITFFCVHGNHEERPENISTYKTKEFHNGIVYYEEEYQNILFAKDGQIYDFNNLKTLVVGGACSNDKGYRIRVGIQWFESELPTVEQKKEILKSIELNKDNIDVILTHTCPFKYLPIDSYIKFIDSENSYNDFEKWLDMLLELNYIKWYCGHYHINRTVDKIKFIYNDIVQFIGDDNV